MVQDADVESWAGGAVGITAKAHNFIAALSFRRFHPTGTWYKCPDCASAVMQRRQINGHRDLHYRAGDYDLPEDDDGEHDAGGPDSGRAGQGGSDD